MYHDTGSYLKSSTSPETMSCAPDGAISRAVCRDAPDAQKS